MDQFSKWFELNSGYTLHRLRLRPLKGCCKNHLCELEKQIYLPAVKEPLPLFQCGVCKRYYARTDRGFYHIDHLLRYRVETKTTQNN